MRAFIHEWKKTFLMIVCVCLCDGVTEIWKKFNSLIHGKIFHPPTNEGLKSGSISDSANARMIVAKQSFSQLVDRNRTQLNRIMKFTLVLCGFFVVPTL